eukprot:345787_1
MSGDDLEFKNENFGQEVAALVMSSVQDIFQSSLSYNHSRCSQLATQIVDRIISDAMKLPMPRKYVCTCHFIQKNGAGVTSSISTFWDPDSDDHFTHTQENTGMLCITTLYGICL